MKFIRFLSVLWVLIPCVSAMAATGDFQNASKLLVAARRGDVQTVQVLVNSGVDVNYVDSTGLSLVCTAVMNNDTRAIQVLQMYGADASQCDKQIKQYKQRTKVASSGEEYGFFSGLSSTHVIVLSAVGIAAVLGGVVLLTKAFDNDGNHNSGGSSGNRPNNNESGSSSAQQGLTTPYGPAYLTSSGTVNTSFDLSDNLSSWDSGSHASYFEYLTLNGSDNFLSDGLNTRLQNYLLMMGGYYSLASGYLGQKIFRDVSSRVPLLTETGYQKQPIRVGLISGNGINPSGSAGFGDGIVYVTSTSVNAETTRVDKYINNNLTKKVVGDDVEYIHTEQSGFDLSGSGSVFNPFVDVNESALAKIVAGWEAGGNPSYDLYGFVPNGQLAIYRTGDGSVWQTITTATDRPFVGDFVDTDSDGNLSAGDTLTKDGKVYNIVTALSESASIINPTVVVAGTTYKLSVNSGMFIAKCADSSGCSDFAIYVGTDGAWYVNTTGGEDIDAVYILTGNEVYQYKNKVSSPYTNFLAIQAAVGVSDVVANTDVLAASRDNNYTTIGTFKKDASINGASDLNQFYQDKITSIYGVGQGGIANTLFNSYSSSKPILVMPAGEYLYIDSSGNVHLLTADATFENYAPLLYGGNLNHNFMTVIAVSHDEGTLDATSIESYGDGIGSAYGKLNLSIWRDSDDNVYMSRKCGIAGVGSSSAGVDPWCFAAAGPTAEMATASAAGAVASLKSAFDYMDNNQIFTLLALTADGPYLHADTSGTVFTNDSLAAYLQDMYDMPGEYEISSLSSSDYLDLFKQVYGYGLINLERAIKPGFTIYYYDSTTNNIVSSNGNKFWGKASTTSRASSVLSLTNRSAIKTSFYDIVESSDGSVSLPRIWNTTFSNNDNSKHGLYMGDVLADFDVNSTNKRTNKIDNITIDMAMSARAYDDNLNGLDDLRIAFTNDKYDLDAEYQHYLTDGESRFSGRANGLLSLVSDSIATGARYKYDNFSFGGRVFSGAITDENLLENDPMVSSQFEPGRLGFSNGVEIDTEYNNEKFAFNIAFGNMNETNTVLGMYSDGLLTLSGAETRYIDMTVEYKPIETVKLFVRGTVADTSVDKVSGLISDISNIKSNAFAFGADMSGFSFTAALPLAVVDGKMGYGYAEFETVANDKGYEIAMNNPHVEYVNLSPRNRELRFSGSYKTSVGDFTDVGVGFIYRVHPNNTDLFGNESIFMFKMHHRLGI